MIILHCCWVPDGGELHGGEAGDSEKEAPFGGKFFLWGESTTPQERRRFPGPSRKEHPKKHPWQVNPSVISENFKELLSDLKSNTFFDSLEPNSRILFLPTDEKNDVPQPSASWVIEDLDVDFTPDSPSILPWEIWGTSVAIDSGLSLFSSDPDYFRQAFHPGRELAFVYNTVEFARSLLNRQRFIPALHRNDTGSLEARWRPLLDLPGDQKYFDDLATSAPAALFAVAKGENDPFQKSGAETYLRGMLSTMIDHKIREELARNGWGDDFRTGKKKDRSESVGLKWLNHLGDRNNPQMDLSAREDRRLTTSYGNWIRAIRKTSEGGLRTGFKLVPPAEKSDGSPLFSSQEGWKLDFFLETIDSESFHLTAEELWARDEEELEPLRERYGSPKEKLLTDLGVASNLFSAIDSGLKSKQPTGCHLSVNEAYQYLKEGYWLLKEAGFLTRVPSWWDPTSLETDAELGLKASVSPEKNSGGGSIGSAGGWNSPIDFEWQLAVGDETITAEEFEKLASLKSPLVKIWGQWVELDPDDVEKTLDFLTENEGERLNLNETAQKILSDSKESPLPITDLQVPDGRKESEGEKENWIDKLVFGDNDGDRGPEEAELGEAPSEFHGELWEHQEKGLAWLLSLTSRGFSPCLADDMGLGKTIQLLAALLKFKHGDGEFPDPTPSLLVCPTSVLGNWGREVERFAPSLSQMIHHGGNRLQGQEFIQAARETDLTVTSYGLLRNDFGLLNEIDWRVVALDEAQKIKNPETKTARRARDLPSKVRVALTGTPIENNLMELWSIMEFLNPGYLGPKRDFQNEYAKPIQQKRKGSRQKQKTLKKLVDPFVLSRKKTDPEILSDLPEKIEKKEYCSLTPEQASLYQAVVDEAGDRLDEAEKDEGDMKKRGCILSTINRLKQICNHPAHFLSEEGFDPGRSGKTERLLDILETVLDEGYSALLFTQYVEFGQKIRDLLQERFHYHVPFLHGGTSQKARDEMIDGFQRQEERLPFFLLSLRAGGLGINLTEASYVIHIDRWWNPAVESQATDRAHRIGQQNNVTVHKFVSSGTYEEEIDRMIEEKKELAEEIVGSGEEGLTELSKQEFMNLIKLREG
ncbi:MAG: DEAD/DEAH box helicase [Candidatus Acetothermia bacterium]